MQYFFFSIHNLFFCITSKCEKFTDQQELSRIYAQVLELVSGVRKCDVAFFVHLGGKNTTQEIIRTLVACCHLLSSWFLLSMMLFFMAELQRHSRLLVSASIALCTVYAATQRGHIQNKQPHKYTRCLLEPNFKNKLHENTCNGIFHLQHLTKKIKVKRKIKWWRKS